MPPSQAAVTMWLPAVGGPQSPALPMNTKGTALSESAAGAGNGQSPATTIRAYAVALRIEGLTCIDVLSCWMVKPSSGSTPSPLSSPDPSLLRGAVPQEFRRRIADGGRAVVRRGHLEGLPRADVPGGLLAEPGQRLDAHPRLRIARGQPENRLQRKRALAAHDVQRPLEQAGIRLTPENLHDRVERRPLIEIGREVFERPRALAGIGIGERGAAQARHVGAVWLRRPGGCARP